MLNIPTHVNAAIKSIPGAVVEYLNLIGTAKLNR